MLVLAAVALGCFAVGRTERAPVTGIGVAAVALELENAWRGNHATIVLAAAASGVALLAAYELESWAVQLATSGTDLEASRAQRRELVRGLAVVTGVTALLAALALAIPHETFLGIVGGLAVIVVGVGVLWLMRRPAKAG
jgi:high-affinity Fe2+/Pb2+ permease